MRFYYLFSLMEDITFLSVTKPTVDFTPQFLNIKGFSIDKDQLSDFNANPISFVEKNFIGKQKDQLISIDKIRDIQKIIIDEMIDIWCHINDEGTKIWYLNGQIHRESGPAKEFYNGEKHWMVRSILHRTNGPAIEKPNGAFTWYKEGKIHREDGPAVSDSAGVKYMINNLIHREDGPAVELNNGEKMWYKSGVLHREDGPAHITGDGNKFWYLNNKRLDEQTFKIKMSERFL